MSLFLMISVVQGSSALHRMKDVVSPVHGDTTVLHQTINNVQHVFILFYKTLWILQVKIQF